MPRARALRCWAAAGLLYAAAAVCAVNVVPKVKLRDGNEMPGIALGTWLGNSTAGRVVPEYSETEQAVQWALEAGYRHVDTASAYRVEDQVGRAVAAALAAGTLVRGDVFITTKLWNDAHARAAVAPALQASLRRLGLGRVDLYLMHWPIGQFANGTYDITDYLDTWRGMVEAKALGLASSIGVSNFNEAMLERLRASGLETPAALQVELNLNLQQPSLLAYCRARRIAVMGYTPFGSLFPGKARPDAPPPRVDQPELVAIARRHNKTVPQIALRYLVELGVVPLPKSLTRSRIQQNLQVFDFSLSQDERDFLRGYDRGYRTIPQLKWLDHPYYPFEKPAAASPPTPNVD